MDPHGNYDIKIDNFAKAPTMASAPPLRILLPRREANREQEGHGRIGIKVGNPANTTEKAPLVRSRPLWSTYRPVEAEMTLKCGLFVRLEAKPGKERAVKEFLVSGLDLTNQEVGTPVWFALQLSPTTFGVFDAFASEEDRQAHLAGNMAKALISRVEEMIARPPSVEPVDILAMKNQPA
jgi:quinol monooxygenase YgiN